MDYPKNIPHDNLQHHPVHITYRLHGSLPKSIINELAKRRNRQLDQLEGSLAGIPSSQQEEFIAFRRLEIDGRYTLAIDKALHTMENPVSFRLQKQMAQKIVIDSWLHFQLKEEVFVYAICVMGNHVHAIIRSFHVATVLPLSRIMENHKGFTARMLNRHFGTTGQPFWAKGYFDRRVRRGKFNTAVWYVLNNPVKAGLVENWWEWEGTYLHPEYQALFRG